MPEISPDDLRSLLVENATLAEQLEAGEADRDRVVGAWSEVQAELESLRRQLEEATRALAAAEEGAGSLLAERNRLSESLGVANAQLGGEQPAPVLPPSEVSALVDRLVSGIQSQLSGMAVRDGELQLKVGFGQVGGHPGFVVPTPQSPPEVRENLHTISIHFNREHD